VEQLPELLKALAPQPGVLGESRIYSFPGLHGDNGADINKLLLSTSGITLINSLLNEGKLGTVLQQVKGLLNPETSPESPEAPSLANESDPLDLA
jgi:uncharacterized membrane protein YqiK